MWKKVNGIIKYSLLTMFLIIGIMSCTIGVTWCRYQVRQNYDVSFIARNPGKYYMTEMPEGQDVGVWQFDAEKDGLRTDFIISNGEEEYSEEDTAFCLRLLATEGVTLQPEVKLIITDMGGREVEYIGIPKVLSESDEDTKELYEQVGNGALYRFFDEEGMEVKMELKGGEKSSQICSITVSAVPESFLAEIMVVDSSYSIEDINLDTMYLRQEFLLESNYLTQDGNRTILLDKWTTSGSSSSAADITLTAQGIESVGTISCATESPYITASLEWVEPIPEEAEVSTSQEVQFKEDGTQTLKLKVIPIQSSIAGLSETVQADVKVTWQIDAPEVEPLSATFRVTIEPGAGVETLDIPTDAALSFIRSGEGRFNQNSPIQMEIYTDGSYDTVKLQNGEELFPANTRYSVDGGNSWYVLQKSGTIDVGVKLIGEQETSQESETEKATEATVMIDLSSAIDEWGVDAYIITGNAYYKNNLVTTADAVFTMENKEIPLMTVTLPEEVPIVTDQNSWYVDAQFSGDEVEVVSYTAERLTPEGYRAVASEDGIIVTNVMGADGKSYRVTVTTAQGQRPAAGTYRITFVQTYDGKEVAREEVYFFVNYRYGS